jgi:uncharacterized membrane protein (UPF0136 family)
MEAAKIYFIIFGLLTIAGGIVGYVKAGSTASIIAGAITGILLLVAAFLLPEHRVAGLATALIISVLLAGQFVPKFFRTGRVMPAGMMSVLSVIGIIAAIVAFVRGGGWFWFCSPRFSPRLSIAGSRLSDCNASRLLRYPKRRRRHRRQPGRR